MPSRNVVKVYEPETSYHVYNRGVEKRVIFKDERDYAVFLSYLKFALLSLDEFKELEKSEIELISDSQRFNLRRLSLNGRLKLLSFCLMPNHFHLLFYQQDQDAITKLMRSTMTGYSMYFNKRYDRVGSLFQGVYKASKIKTDAYWLHISRYIHLNAVDIRDNYKTYPYSSMRNYLGFANALWLNDKMILKSFRGTKDYEKFCDEAIETRQEIAEIKDMLANSKELE